MHSNSVGGMASVSNKGLIQDGKSVSVTAKANKGYALVGWSYVFQDNMNPYVDYDPVVEPTFIFSADKITDIIEHGGSPKLAYDVKAVFVSVDECERPENVGFFDLEEEYAVNNTFSLYAGVALCSNDRGHKFRLDVYPGRPENKHCPVTYSAKNLPPGITIDKYYGCLGGVPTKPGVYQVEFTATSTVNTKAVAKKTYKFRIEALPNSLIGNLNGDVESSLNGVVSVGMTTLTIGSTGKITGSIPVNGKNLTLAATSLTDLAVYDGMDEKDGLSYRGTARASGTAVYGKEKCGFDILIAFEEVYSKVRDAKGRQYLLKSVTVNGLRFYPLGDETAGDVGYGMMPTEQNGHSPIVIPQFGIELNGIFFSRNVGKDEGVVDALGAMAGTYADKFAWESGNTSDGSVIVNKNGTAQFKATLPNGTKTSGALSLLGYDHVFNSSSEIGQQLSRDNVCDYIMMSVVPLKTGVVEAWIDFSEDNEHPYQSPFFEVNYFDTKSGDETSGEFSLSK